MTPFQKIIHFRNALAAAHYYLDKAHAEFLDAIEAPDASKPGEKFNEREEAAHEAMMDLQAEAITAAEHLLGALGINVCEEYRAELTALPSMKAN